MYKENNLAILLANFFLPTLEPLSVVFCKCLMESWLEPHFFTFIIFFSTLHSQLLNLLLY